MAGFAKGIIVAILISVVTIVMMNLAFYFPFYITVIETAFEVSQIVSNENYLPYDDYQSIYNQLCDKPIFNKNKDSISIDVETVEGGTVYAGKNCKEQGSDRGAEFYYNSPNKPYVQRGEPICITVKATYPFQMTLMGQELELVGIPAHMSIRTTSLKYYKDLPYYVD